MHTVWVFITDCGDSAVTVPLALLVLIFLVVSRQQRVACAWILTVGGAAIVIAALKLAFGACGTAIAGSHIVSPSGHTAMSTAVYGALALLSGSRLPAGRRYAVYAAAGAAIVGIALSRVVLHEHNFAEIVVGWIVGAVRSRPLPWRSAGNRRRRCRSAGWRCAASSWSRSCMAPAGMWNPPCAMSPGCFAWRCRFAASGAGQAARSAGPGRSLARPSFASTSRTGSTAAFSTA